MDAELLILLLGSAGWGWALLGWLGKNQWAWPLLQRFSRWLGRRLPGRESILRLEKGLEHLSDNFALLRLRQEAIENQTKAAIVITDAKGELVWASFSFLDLVQRSLQDVIGANWINCIHQDDREEVARTWKAAVETDSNFVMDFRYWQKRDQREVWVTASAKAAHNNWTGHTAGWTASIEVLDRPPAWARPHHEDCPAGHWVPPLDRPGFSG